jgi:hypothetical protein
MSDRLDEQLARLPGEPPAHDLAARIQSAVADRRRARARWRRFQAATLACAVAGALCVGVSWSTAAVSLDTAFDALEADTPLAALQVALTAPVETLADWLDAGLTWQAALVEGVGVVFVLGVALLAMAAFGGLAQSLNTGTPNGYGSEVG